MSVLITMYTVARLMDSVSVASAPSLEKTVVHGDDLRIFHDACLSDDHNPELCVIHSNDSLCLGDSIADDQIQLSYDLERPHLCVLLAVSCLADDVSLVVELAAENVLCH